MSLIRLTEQNRLASFLTNITLHMTPRETRQHFVCFFHLKVQAGFETVKWIETIIHLIWNIFWKDDGCVWCYFTLELELHSFSESTANCNQFKSCPVKQTRIYRSLSFLQFIQQNCTCIPLELVCFSLKLLIISVALTNYRSNIIRVHSDITAI